MPESTREARSRSRAFVGAGVALLLYTAITACFWAPARNRFAEQFVGDGGDNFVFVWNPWWLSRCLSEFRNPYFCDVQYAPFGAPLVFHCLAVIPSLIITALTKLVSLPLAYNLVAVGLCPIAGLCAYLLARHVTRDYLGAIVGGAVFMFCPFITSKLLGHMNLACAAFLPLYVLCLLRAVDDRLPRWRIWLTLSYALILFSSESALVFAANVTVWYWLYRIVCGPRRREEIGRFWWALWPIGAITAVWGAFVLYYGVRYGVAPSRHGILPACPEPLNFLLPIHSMSVWREWFLPPGTLGVQLSNLELAVYLGWFVLPLAVAGFWCRRRDRLMRFMAIAFACAAILALGHRLQWDRELVRIAGHSVRLPMVLYRHVPVLGAIGQSGRYMAIGYMAMAVMAAGLIAHVRLRLGPKGGLAASAAALAAICCDYAYRTPTVEAPVCVIKPGERRVMDPRIEISHSLYGQTLHGRALVGGYISRPPPRIHEEYEAMPGVGWFFKLPLTRGAPPSPEAVRDGLRRLNVEYVCVAPHGEDRQVLEGAGLRVVYESEWDVTLILEPATAGGSPYRPSGSSSPGGGGSRPSSRAAGDLSGR